MSLRIEDGFRKERFRETLWREAAGWLTEQAA